MEQFLKAFLPVLELSDAGAEGWWPWLDSYRVSALRIGTVAWCAACICGTFAIAANFAFSTYVAGPNVSPRAVIGLDTTGPSAAGGIVVMKFRCHVYSDQAHVSGGAPRSSW